jgi:hypothetical protein
MKITVTRTVSLSVDIDSHELLETAPMEAAASWVLGETLSKEATTEHFVDELSSRLGWTINSATFTYEEPQYRVLFATTYGWESWDTYFDTLSDAVAAISETVKDSLEEHEAGNLAAPFPLSDFRITCGGIYYDHNGTEL